MCFGVPGIGKTLSAVHYCRNESFSVRHPPAAADPEPLDTILYTTGVINTPSRIDIEVRRAREFLLDRATKGIRTEARETLDKLRVRDEDWRSKHRNDPDYRSAQLPPFTPTYFHAFEAYEARKMAIPDPTTLIIVDEADRLTMPSLEQFRSIFDESRLALVLVGMPGLEKRAARYPQFFSRIGFVREFRTLAPDEVQHLLEENWATISNGFLTTPPSPRSSPRLFALPAGTSGLSPGYSPKWNV